MPAFAAAHDEFMFAVAQQLDELVSKHGPLMGSAEVVNATVKCLAELARAKETVVRDSAVRGLLSALDHSVGGGWSDKLLAAASEHDGAFRSLSKGEDQWYSARVSACRVLPKLYLFLQGPGSGGKPSSETQLFSKEVVTSVTKLCEDPTPMVRRAAGAMVSEFAVVLMELGDVAVFMDILPIWAKLCTDADESVRVVVVRGLHKMTPMIQKALEAGHSAPGLNLHDLSARLCGDPSWKIRQAVAGQIGPIIASMDPSAKDQWEKMRTEYLDLVRDPETEVKIICIGQLPVALEGNYAAHVAACDEFAAQVLSTVMPITDQVLQVQVRACE